jgi:regulator of protease activity HflC (stomatin/prohibitin superfamily)
LSARHRKPPLNERIGFMDIYTSVIIGLAALLIIVIIIKNILIVQQAQAFVVERLGAYSTTWDVGLHFKIPFIERVVKKVSLKEQVADFQPQPVITKDNVTMQIDTVVYFQITDPKLYTYGIEQPLLAIENLTATTLRNLIGDLELDETLTSRDTINSKMRIILDEATDPWGIKVNRVELKNILPPKQIQDAMEKQMKAERERREAILQAEGEKASKILVAEGEKQSTILRADGDKQSKILQADGEAQAILLVQKALAESIKLLNEAAPSDPVIRIKALEAFQAAANGRATKIIIPSEIQGLAGLATSLKEVLIDPKQPEKKPGDVKKAD